MCHNTHKQNLIYLKGIDPLSSVWICMWESTVESIIIISFAQNFFKNSLNQSVIRDHLGNCLVNNVIVSGDVLKAELYNNMRGDNSNKCCFGT